MDLRLIVELDGFQYGPDPSVLKRIVLQPLHASPNGIFAFQTDFLLHDPIQAHQTYCYAASSFDISLPHAVNTSFSDLFQPENQPPGFSTAYSSTDQANLTNREAVDISIEYNHEPSIVQPSSPVQQIPSEPQEEFETSEDSSLEAILPIDSSRVQSGPHIALEVENVSGTDARERNQTANTGIAFHPQQILEMARVISILAEDSVKSILEENATVFFT
ncbi:hypothetical protein OS493_036169 [Desmophyllum pertusum]|uniref:Uncharacterized protein n=1 Tax=Desmophyllum pertusum TaxID=174260 RepID=A0A9W9ZIR6_9CNID|nr:hypothetical protein OS493_036169 [Desmophyllum pertusum]